MPHQPVTVAGIEVFPLCDAVGPMGDAIRRPLPEMFPGGCHGESGEWILHFHCYLLRDGAGRTVLVDTGVGGDDSPASSWAPVPGRLLAELAHVAVSPEAVDAVVITHLHSDHASGAVTGGSPVFPNARHVLQRAEIEAADESVLDHVIRPLGERVQAVDGGAEVLPGIHVLPTPGHTPGHQVVRVGDLVLTGDVVLHPVQLENPRVPYLYDADPELAAATRAELLDRVRAERGMIGTAHFAEPFVRLG
ncbi:glyoxylase-like metal-dependent hydrolase (beta-lactamase superfamily II) [Streptosporangium becharense]|uniref:Glyoxylase-like metal-dependent hydrolase (Beta-lactamase superfamily II) n=1 Tax=Streptosporangium becharense TaxID=1816182 RepID=A0A7W9IGD8_9ACTN|nr:MBL fold metallo-hydrolase [Streptosporangium becharense]MBB2908931.1 glyoxylase-like metal-dependent hydrolase (beta-lactamase superfamily II) [Streptosporangium becharense]MBB5820051.1 glyoxylase-like metal-dependent hydrolase (beta-lactamase superfamily II) [Streptosporangium becharense]